MYAHPALLASKCPQTDPEENESAYDLGHVCVDVVSEASWRCSVQVEYQSGIFKVDSSDEHVEHGCACLNRFLAWFPQHLRHRRASPSAQEEEIKPEFRQARRIPAHRNPNGPCRKVVLEKQVLAFETEADKCEQEPHGLMWLVIQPSEK
jgi:hypothetical protein